MEGHSAQFGRARLHWFVTEAAAIETWANSDFYSETDTEHNSESPRFFDVLTTQLS